jgi:hypothetical protein
VRIDGRQHRLVFGPRLGAPRLREAEEELLILGEAVRDVGVLRGRAQLAIRGERELDAADVGDVLAERELAVDLAAAGMLAGTDGKTDANTGGGGGGGAGVIRILGAQQVNGQISPPPT